ncbi:MAG TPA: hypothetical protein VGM98_14130 [Schlesneria sp.]
MPVKPVLQALVLAERVWTLEDGRKAICGTFTKVVLSKINENRPRDANGTHMVPGGGAGAPWAYISLTGVANETVLQLQFVSLKRNAPVFSTEIQLLGKDRLATVELAIQLPMIMPTESGGYAFDVVCDGEILGSWRVEVEIVVPEKGEDEGSESDDSDGDDDPAEDIG